MKLSANFWSRSLGALLACFLTATQANAAEKQSDRRPNFVIFLTDDQGWGDLGCYGHPRIKSPNLDRFADEGMRFTQCYAACAVCSPSRSAILTGRTPYRNGVWRWIPEGSEYHLRQSETSVASLLREQGYATCHVGKWHLNGKFNSRDQPQPDDHGYDWWLATQNNARPNHINPTNYVRNRQATGKLEGPSAVVAVEEAIHWLKQEKKEDKPFFLTVWTHEPHQPIESAERFMKPYKDLEDAGLRQHHGNITQLDHAFGLLINAIDELGESDNTLVIFTSDNGPEGSGTRPGSRTRGSTGGLRGRKRHTHEGGIRVPGILRWPGHIKPGSVCNTPIIGSDFFPTICQIVGIPLPENRVIDGTSIVPLFSGEAIDRQQPLYWRNHLAPEQYKVGLRQGDWKIIGSDDLKTFELYNLKEDPQETTNLAAKFPERFATMRAQLITHDQSVLADGPDWWKTDEPH
ncbi:MAG: N-acetylgalactosamine-6-sulfatase [Planctomycetaceae bacterium]|nr:N-acetylgalactosamine-6-sulfatase [Planctomycetaceae bacterium]